MVLLRIGMLSRHCLRQTRSVCARERERRSNPEISAWRDAGLLRCARNDEECDAGLHRFARNDGEGAPLMDGIERLRCRGSRSRRCGIGVVCGGLEPLSFPILHVLLVFRRTAPGRHIRRQATSPLRNGIADAG